MLEEAIMVDEELNKQYIRNATETPMLILKIKTFKVELCK
jgi:hypothetical protein